MSQNAAQLSAAEIRDAFMQYAADTLRDSDLLPAIQAVRKAEAVQKSSNTDSETAAWAEEVLKEIHKFNTPLYIHLAKDAEAVAACGAARIADAPIPSVKQAKALPKSTEEERAYRRAVTGTAKTFRRTKQLIKKYYKGNFSVFDDNTVTALTKVRDVLTEDVKRGRFALADAENAEGKEAAQKSLHYDRATLEEAEKQLKKAMKIAAIYRDAVKPYTDAVQLLALRSAYADYEKIAARCESAEARKKEKNA